MSSHAMPAQHIKCDASIPPYHKRATNYRALLRKMTCEDKSRRSSLLQHAVTGWQRCIKYLIFISNFPQKSPIISGSFVGRDLQLKASGATSPPCSDASKIECMLFSAKEPYNEWLFYGKRPAI